MFSPSLKLRRITVTLSLTILACAGVRAQKSGGAYWPLSAGNAWDLQLNVGQDVTINQSLKVTKVTPIKGGSDARIEYTVNGRLVQTEVYRTTAAGMSRISGGPNGSFKFEPPLTVMKFPVKAGDTWNWKGRVLAQGQEIVTTSTWKVSGPEDISTPGGNFKAMRIHADITSMEQSKPQKSGTDYWFVQGVGLVQQTAELNGQKFTGKLTKHSVK